MRRAFSKVRKGRVIAESPSAGRHLARGAAVKLTVSRGRR
jgi:beta-lactam-binding protein with PASTA domain